MFRFVLDAFPSPGAKQCGFSGIAVAVPSIRDVNDKRVLASAILADVDFLITGDKDFTGVEIVRPVILPPAAFLKQW